MLSFRPNLFDLRLSVKQTHACVSFEVHSQGILWHTPSEGRYSAHSELSRKRPVPSRKLDLVHSAANHLHPPLHLGSWSRSSFVGWFVIYRTLGAYIYDMFLRRCVFVICGHAAEITSTAGYQRRSGGGHASPTKIARKPKEYQRAHYTQVTEVPPAVIQSSHGPSVEETVTDNSDSHQHILPAFWQQSPSL